MSSMPTTSFIGSTSNVTDRQDGISVIAKGLSGGEKVVVDGQYRLDNGSKVAVAADDRTGAHDEVSTE